MIRRLAYAFFAVSLGSAPAIAADLGVVGALFEIEETNLLDRLEARFAELEAEGAVEKLREDMTDRTKGYVNEPRPVLGIVKATKTTTRMFDPSMTVEQDLADHRGVIFARAGTVVNPLDYLPSQPPVMLLIDGRDPEQVAWAIGQGDEIDSRIILVSGRPIDLTKEHRRRFYFDQDAIISTRFGLTAVPVRIEAEGRMMKITEVALP